MSATTTPRVGMPYPKPGQASAEAAFAEALNRMDALLPGAANSVGDTTPPGSPAEGDVYCLGASPTGAWSGQGGKVAHFVGGGWLFITPRTGWRVYAVDEAADYRWSGSAWTAVSSGDLVLVERFTAAGGETSKTFSSLGSYQDLHIKMLVRNASSAEMKMRFNSDNTTSNYKCYQTNKYGTNNTTDDLSVWLNGGTPASNYAHIAIIDIPNYRNAIFYKAAHTTHNPRNNSPDSWISLLSTWWTNTAAITQIEFSMTAGSFVAGSVISVYGLR